METITLYTTDCPKCRILEAKLKEGGIVYETCKEVEKMQNLGIMSCPVLSVDGKMLELYDAVQWVKREVK